MPTRAKPQAERIEPKRLVVEEEKGMVPHVLSPRPVAGAERTGGALPRLPIQYKDNIPSVPEGGRTLIVAEDARISSLAQRSYVRVGDYKALPWSRGQYPARADYYVPVQSRMPVRSRFGLFRCVQRDHRWVDAATATLSVSRPAGSTSKMISCMAIITMA